MNANGRRIADRAVLIAAAMVLGMALPVAGADKAVTTVTAENSSGEARAAGPVTFGAIFARGDVPNTLAVRGHTCQVDVKRRWPDGSIKHAVLTVALPAMPAGARETLELVPAGAEGAPRPGGDLKAALGKLDEVLVEFRIHNGPTVAASLAKVIGSAEPKRTWLDGELVREAHFACAPADGAGKADADLEVRFRVRHYPLAGATRVAVVVENTRWASPGGVPYDVTVRVGGKEAFRQEQAGAWSDERHAEYRGHPKYARWVRRFWLGRTLDDVQVRHDARYLFATGLLPRYDPGVQVAEKALAEMADRWAKADTGILQRGTIIAYFPSTGGRPDIGALPRWTARYLLSQDERARRVTWGNADLSGSCPVHVRDPKSDWFLDLGEHPDFSFNERGTKERVAPRDTRDTPWVIAQGSHFTVDDAHQPSLAYVPYLLGGDYYHLEEMGFWAAHNMAVIHYQYRQRDKGILVGQVRGVAWALRNLVHAAALAPDASREKRYFEAKLADNLRHYAAAVSGEGASPLGIYKYGRTHAYTRGWPMDWRSRYYSMPPWQHNFLAWSAAHAADQGYDAAIPFRDYMMTFPIGLMTHAEEITPLAATSYFVFIGRRAGEEGQADWWPNTWKELSDLSYRSPTPPGVTISPPTGISGPEYGCSYGHIARGVVIEALRAGRPGARQALRWIDAQLPDLPRVQGNDPTWAFEVPRD